MGAATSDLTCAAKEFFGFSMDVAFLVAYNNDATTIPNPVIKANITAGSANVPLGMPVYVVNPTAGA